MSSEDHAETAAPNIDELLWDNDVHNFIQVLAGILARFLKETDETQETTD